MAGGTAGVISEIRQQGPHLGPAGQKLPIAVRAVAAHIRTGKSHAGEAHTAHLGNGFPQHDPYAVIVAGPAHTVFLDTRKARPGNDEGAFPAVLLPSLADRLCHQIPIKIVHLLMGCRIPLISKDHIRRHLPVKGGGLIHIHQKPRKPGVQHFLLMDAPPVAHPLL